MRSVLKRACIAGLAVFALTLTTCAGGIASPVPPPANTAAVLISPTSGSPGLPPIPDLRGHLIYTSGQLGELHSQDLTTNRVTVLYQPPEGGHVVSAAVSPDRALIAMAYAPPPAEGEVQFGYTDLVVMPADGSTEPVLLLRGSDRMEIYSWPGWSADGTFLYFGHTTYPDPQNPAVAAIRVERLAYPGGQPEIIADQALWPRLSPDGRRLAYLSRSGQVDSLVISDPDGSNPQDPIQRDRFPAVDAPTFSPDGTRLLFSAVDAIMYHHPNWLEELLDLHVAMAHDVPSDLWQVPIDGGDLVRLTRFSDYGFYPAFSPDGRHIAFLRGSGIYVMDPDGANVARLHEPGPAGTLDWLP